MPMQFPPGHNEFGPIADWERAVLDERDRKAAPPVDYDAERNAKAITVAGLIATLSTCDPNALVWAAGCDCTNPVTGLTDDDARVTMTVAVAR